MDKLRLVYAQTGRARWISHLDAMRTLQRGLLRAGVPLRYSEGFNPHALISIVMPLSVGTESLCQLADIRVQEEVKKLPNYKSIWQTFAVLLPVKSVGVMGDQRTYEYTCAIRSVNSIDAMTADWTHLPYETLGVISNRIINEVRGINRVVYDISSKPPATIEWE